MVTMVSSQELGHRRSDDLLGMNLALHAATSASQWQDVPQSPNSERGLEWLGGRPGGFQKFQQFRQETLLWVLWVL
jgi:hypothetical protein